MPNFGYYYYLYFYYLIVIFQVTVAALLAVVSASPSHHLYSEVETIVEGPKAYIAGPSGKSILRIMSSNEEKRVGKQFLKSSQKIGNFSGSRALKSR